MKMVYSVKSIVLLLLQVRLSGSFFLPIKFCYLPSVHRTSQSIPSVLTATILTAQDEQTNEKLRNDLAQTLLQAALSKGQIGSRLSQKEQDELLSLSKSLCPYSDIAPAQKLLSGEHELIYSASSGGSAGAFGPFVGEVSQRFLNEKDFINQVQFGGGLFKIELEAERKVLDEKRIRVKFLATRVSLLGMKILQKETKGQGVWNHLFSGVVNIDGERILLRVLLTPSLFIIKQKLTE